MKVRDIDITNALEKALPIESFLFNPSIAHVTGDTFLISVRSYVHNSSAPMDYDPKLIYNTQHPWGTDWSGTDNTYILPAVITERNVHHVTSGKWPLVIPVQDMRIFSFFKDGDNICYILTYNEKYQGDKEIMIKGGDSCDEFCYLIGWSYLIVNIRDLNYSFIPGQQPLCMNISNPIEKNWSIWQYTISNKIYLMLSYALTPIHSVFSFCIKGIQHGELLGGSSCRMITHRPSKNPDFLGQLEQYYDNKLAVSLSTPSYEYESGKYQAIGHLKVKVDYIRTMYQGSINTPLAKFVKKYVQGAENIHFNPNYIYMMFIYRFEIMNLRKSSVPEEYNSGIAELLDTGERIKAMVTHISPAFVSKVADYDYYLNFPSGMVITSENTIISYGDGDASSHLLYISNKDVENFLIPITDLTVDKYEFMHGIKDKNGEIIFKK